ncbi:hypothetical protein EC991_003690 [Linnemannia zychae]|nr:hypothetical protein EC991_003690 [Linnemannia zychae]
MMVSDHYHTDSGSLVAWYLSTASEGVEPVPDNGLINGRNSFDCSMAPNALFPTTPGSGNGKNRCFSNAPRAVFDVEQGLRYRIRIINTGSFADFKISVDEHELTVLEADGVDMVPVTVQRVPIHVAQRYSVLLVASHFTTTAEDEVTGKSFWVRAEMNTNCFNVENPALNPSVKAILRYKARSGSAFSGVDGTANSMRKNANKVSSQEIPDSKDWDESAWSPHCDDLKAEMLRPYFARDAPDADVQVVLEMSFMTISHDRVNKGYVNRTTWTPQLHNPTLFQAVDNRENGRNSAAAVFDTSSQLVVTLDKHMAAGLMMQFLALPSQVKAFDIPPELRELCGVNPK